MGGYGKGRGKGARSDGDGPGKAAGKAAIKGKTPTPAQVPALPVPEVPPGTDLLAQHADGKWYPAVVMSQRRAHPQARPAAGVLGPPLARFPPHLGPRRRYLPPGRRRRGPAPPAQAVMPQPWTHAEVGGPVGEAHALWRPVQLGPHRMSFSVHPVALTAQSGNAPPPMSQSSTEVNRDPSERKLKDVEHVDLFLGLPKIVWVIAADVVAVGAFIISIRFVNGLGRRSPLDS